MDIDTTPKSGASAMVPVGIGIVALVIGAAALFFALSNGSAADASNKRISDLESKVSDMQAAVDKANSQAASAASQVSSLAQGEQNDIKKAYTDIGAALTERDKVITDIQQKLAESPGGHSSASSGAGSSANPGPGGTYKIQSGDIFASLARKFGVSITALEDANPGVDPKKLKIGQQINIPGPSAAAPKPAATSSASSSASAPTATTP